MKTKTWKTHVSKSFVQPMILSLALAVACIGGAQAPALADTRETVASIDTDAEPGRWELAILRDDEGAMKGLTYFSVTDPSDVPKVFTLEKLLEGAQVLKEQDGRQIILLSVEDGFDAKKGGFVTVRFLQSGISGAYRNFRILVDAQRDIVLRSSPNQNDPESDGNRFTSVFNHLFLAKNTFFGRTIGIARVMPSFAE